MPKIYGVLAAPCDYGSAMAHVEGYLIEQGHLIVKIEEWELRDGKWDDDEGDIPADLLKEWGGKDCCCIIWIGEPGDTPPTKLQMLESALAGGCVPTDT